MEELADKKCVPCKGGTPRLTGEKINALHCRLGDTWKVIEEHHLEKRFGFKDFVSALDFVNTVGELAEEQNHHPDIHLGWGYCKVQIWTHKIDGLTESDFVFAAKCEAIFNAFEDSKDAQ